MNNKRKQFIKDRQYGKSTEYYPCGHLINIPNVGKFPRLIKKDENEEEMASTFILSAVTHNFVYYLDEEVDNIEQALMVNRKYQLVSDNYFAYNSLSEIIGSNESLLWMSKAVKTWQREQYIQPHLLTPEIIKRLNKVDIDILIKKQKKVYYAFLNNGPVKYTKAEALMAVFANADLIPDITLEPQKLLSDKKQNEDNV